MGPMVVDYANPFSGGHFRTSFKIQVCTLTAYQHNNTAQHITANKVRQYAIRQSHE